MKRILLLLAWLAAGIAAPVSADLVRVGPAISFSFSNVDQGFALATARNRASGEHATCSAISDGAVNGVSCWRFSAQDELLMVHTITTEQISHIDAAMADNGNLYLTVHVVNAPVLNAGMGRLVGWNPQGTQLFSVVLPPMEAFDEIDVAAIVSGPLVAVTRQFNNQPDRQAMTLYGYNEQGVLTSTVEAVAPLEGGYDGSCLAGQASDLAVSRTGDIGLVWMKTAVTSIPCGGTILTRTIRLSGVASAVRQLSTIVRDDSGVDVSSNYNPRLAALDDDRFVVGWSRDAVEDLPAAGMTAAINQAGGVAAPETLVFRGTGVDGGGFAFGADAASGNFVLLGMPDPNPGCVLQAQLAFEANLTPVTRFPLEDCNATNFDLQFVSPEEIIVTTVHGPNLLTLRRVTLPALVEVNNVSVSEGDPASGSNLVATLSLALSKPHPTGEDVHVSYVTRNGTAIADQDFAFTQDSATISASSMPPVTTANVALIPDNDYEDDEHFTVELLTPSNAVLRRGDENATITILDDDDTPPITPDCTGGDPLQCRTLEEPDLGQSSVATITLTMAQPVGLDVRINYATVDGTAIAGTNGDYIARSGSVHLIAGSTTATIPLTILGDDTPERTESFQLRLSAADGIHLSPADLVILINDDACFLEVCHPATVGGTCVHTPPPIFVTTNQQGGAESLQVTSRLGCGWTVSTPPGQDWIDVTSAASNSGSGTVLFDVAEYPGPDNTVPRQGKITLTLAVPLRTVDVDVIQDGDCGFTLDHTASDIFPVEGGNGGFQVTTSRPQCAWEVTSDTDWVSVLTPSTPVFGDGAATYQVDANDGEVNVESDGRELDLELESAHAIYKVRQAGCQYGLDIGTGPHPTTPPYDISMPAEGPVPANGGVSVSVDVDTSSVCRWTASTQAPWILIRNGAAGTGEGPVEIFVLDNPTVMERIASVYIGDEVLHVTQAGLDCNYAMAPASIASCPDGRTFDLAVAAHNGCLWTVQADAPWVTLVPGYSGDGSDDVSGAVALNLSESPRTATLQLRAQNVGVASTAVTQEGYLTYEAFEGARPGDWIYQPDAAWTAATGSLVGQALGQGTAVALDPSSSCTECEIEARVAVASLASGPGDVLTVLGWYRDANNHVGLAMDEFSNRWTLYQVASGVRSSVAADVGKILPNTLYAVRVVFDGTSFAAEVDGLPLLQIPLQSDAPDGRAGLQLAGGNGRIAELRITALVGSGTPVVPDRIVVSGFEDGEGAPSGPNSSQCALGD